MYYIRARSRGGVSNPALGEKYYSTNPPPLPPPLERHRVKSRGQQWGK